MSEKLHMHFDCHPGLTMDGIEVKMVPNALGFETWIATSQIGTIFGAEVNGEIRGIGPTKEKALERLAEERKKLHDSMFE